MNSSQKEVQQANLQAEKKVIRQLKQVYEQASKDCAAKIAELDSRTDLQNLQSIVYQRQYQQMLKSQIDGILATLQSSEFDSIASYLTESYQNGYTGAMYDLQKQGIPVTVPLQQSQVVKAVQTDSKLSTAMYNRLGEDVTALKKSIKAELSRGVANGSSWAEIAQKIASGMSSPYKKAFNNAIRIARTEGHRIQQESQLDALKEASDAGADIVKQWDATLDSRTRPDHQAADGQIVELDEYFRVGGERMKAPGVGGSARNVCNCRCCMLQRARWALDEDELKTLQSRAKYFGLDKTADFNAFKQKYLNLPANAAIIDITISDEVQKFTEGIEKSGVTYREVSMRDSPLSESEIIDAVSGGDRTSGSCASVALAYAGQKQGLDVLDFRDGSSRDFFSSKANKVSMFKALGAKSIVADSAKSSLTNGKRILAQLTEGKEYYLSVGRHAAIVRNNQGTYQYLELQSSRSNGWKDFGNDVGYTLQNRFGCSSSSRYYSTAYATDISQLQGEDFRAVLGYINTATDE